MSFSKNLFFILNYNLGLNYFKKSYTKTYTFVTLTNSMGETPYVDIFMFLYQNYYPHWATQSCIIYDQIY